MTAPTSPPPASPPPAFPAATIIIARPSDPADAHLSGPFEVLLLQRHTRSRFMPGAYVYPGGRVDPIDADPALLSDLTTGRDPSACAAALQAPDLAPLDAASLFTAALREAFEEAGVLITTPAPSPPLDADALSSWRHTVHADHAQWLHLLSSLGLRLDLTAVHPVAHWITPEAEPRRFDTFFFLAVCPPWQRDLLRHDAQETIASVWLSPADALTRHAQGDLMLPPPTFCTIAALSRAPSLAAALAAAPSLPIPTILPLHRLIDDTLHIILPSDPDHPQYPMPDTNPRRVILRGDHWEPIW